MIKIEAKEEKRDTKIKSHREKIENKQEVKKAEIGDRVTLFPKEYKKGETMNGACIYRRYKQLFCG